MALSDPALVVADPDTSNVASFTAAATVTTGDLVLAGVWNTDGTDAVEGTFASSFSVTGGAWTKLCTVQASAATRRLTLWGAVVETGAAGAVTAAFGGDNQTGCIIDVVAISGQSAAATAQTAADEGGGSGATSLAITLASALGATANMIVAFIGHNANEVQEPGGGATEVTGSDVGYSSPTARLGSYWERNDNSVSASWATSSAKLAVAVEVVAAAEGGGGETTKHSRLTVLGVS